MKLFEHRFQPARIALLVVLGSALILVSRARHIAAQSPKVAVLPAPELVGGPWMNAPGPISLASRRGKVTMVEFWTFACANCQANLPAYERWQREFSPRGFTIIGIHTPELEIERDASQLKSFIVKEGITYPILVDPKNENWSRWHQECWPTIYLVDKAGRVRFKWIGELNSMGSGGERIVEGRIDSLLKE